MRNEIVAKYTNRVAEYDAFQYSKGKNLPEVKAFIAGKNVKDYDDEKDDHFDRDDDEDGKDDDERTVVVTGATIESSSGKGLPTLEDGDYVLRDNVTMKIVVVSEPDFKRLYMKV